ncbi:hypothetical protein HDU93_006061, partial [Gonapodya sp. JEL0774]
MPPKRKTTAPSSKPKAPAPPPPKVYKRKLDHEDADADVHMTDDTPPAAAEKHGGKKAKKVVDNGGGPWSLQRCTRWFQSLTSKDEPDQIGPEGIERLCEDSGIAPDGLEMLTVAYVVGASRMSYFTRQEFVSGMERLGADTPAKLAKSAQERAQKIVEGEWR